MSDTTKIDPANPGSINGTRKPGPKPAGAAPAPGATRTSGRPVDPPFKPRGPYAKTKGKRVGSAPEAAEQGAEQAQAAPGNPNAGTHEKAGRAKGRAKETDIASVAERLLQYHTLAALFAKAPELMISPQEARALAEQGLALADEFDVSIGGRWVVVATFAFTAAGVYLPRVAAIAERQQRQARPAPQPNRPQHTGGPAPHYEPEVPVSNGPTIEGTAEEIGRGTGAHH